MASGHPADQHPDLPEHDEFTESVLDSIDRMRNDGGVAPELPHRETTLAERGVLAEATASEDQTSEVRLRQDGQR
ncbi:MAG: hypothetical protein K6T26_00355 [Alicyclobacillus sp.]|nr:hypothetical protein [Alicyclobacillus sp.]